METTRRDALAHGGKVIVAAAVLSTLPSVADAKDDAELFAFFEKCKQLETEMMAATNRYDEALFAVRGRFPDQPPNYRELWQRIRNPGTPEREAVLHRPGALLEALNYVERDAREKWQADLAEADEQAGVPALKKKDDAATQAWLDAMHRFYDMLAHTPEGMILKLTNEWTDGMWRAWRAKDSSERFEFHPDAIPSVLLDIERLSGRRA